MPTVHVGERSPLQPVRVETGVRARDVQLHSEPGHSLRARRR